MSKTIIAVRHFALGGRESLETAVIYEKFDLSTYVLVDTTLPDFDAQKY